MTQAQRSCLPSVAFMARSTDGTGDEVSNSLGRDKDSGLSLRVLIVEDEGVVAMNMESALAEAGFRVMGVVDTEADAVAAAERMQPDIILIDITLREGDGISAAKTIRKSLKTLIIFVSGNSDPTTLAAAEKVNPAAFIRKPFVTDRLAKLVMDAVATKN